MLDHVRTAVDLDDHPTFEILGGNHADRPPFNIAFKIVGMKHASSLAQVALSILPAWPGSGQNPRAGVACFEWARFRSSFREKAGNPIDTRVRVC